MLDVMPALSRIFHLSPEQIWGLDLREYNAYIDAINDASETG